MHLTHICNAKTICAVAAAVFQSFSASALPQIPVTESFNEAVVQVCPSTLNSAETRLAALERKRLLYDARTNTVIMTNQASAAHQEIPSGMKI